MVVAGAAALLVSLDTTVNIAFPAITATFRLEVSQIQWVVVSYVLTLASLLLATGRLSDSFDVYARRVNRFIRSLRISSALLAISASDLRR